MINQSNVQQVPQGVTQQRQGFPSLPKPGEVNFLNASHDDISFEMNPNTGAFEIVDKRTKPADQQPQQTTNSQNGNNVTNNQQDNSQPADPYQARFAAIENHNKMLQDALIRMAQAMDGMVNNQNGNQQQQGQQQQVQLDIQSDDFTTNLVNVINNAIDTKLKSFEEKIQPLQQTTVNMQGRMEMADVAFQNKDFQELFPIIQEIKKSDPTGTLSWQKAYESAKTIQGTFSKQDSTIRTDNGSVRSQPSQQEMLGANSGKPQSGTNDLRQVANQLATETGGVSRSVVNNEPRINSVESAFNEAVNELFGGRI